MIIAQNNFLIRKKIENILEYGQNLNTLKVLFCDQN